MKKIANIFTVCTKYFMLSYICYIILLLPPKDYKHYLTTYVTPANVNTAFNIMLVNPRSNTLTLEMQILLNFATGYKYLGHVICSDLSDETDIQAKVRLLYAKRNMLRQNHPQNGCLLQMTRHILLVSYNDAWVEWI